MNPEQIIKRAGELRWKLPQDFHDRAVEIIYAESARIAGRNVEQQGKTYRLTYSGLSLGATESRLFAAGLILPDGLRCRPAILTPLQDNIADLAIHEGKFHQVKNMIQAVGRKVITLHRMTFGPLELDEMLSPGSSRELTPAEANALYKVVQLEKT